MLLSSLRISIALAMNDIRCNLQICTLGQLQWQSLQYNDFHSLYLRHINNRHNTHLQYGVITYKSLLLFMYYLRTGQFDLSEQ